MMIALHWEGGIHPIYIFISKDKVVASENPLIDEPSLTSYKISQYFTGKQLYFWLNIRNDNIIFSDLSGGPGSSNPSFVAPVTFVTHPNLQNKDANLRIIDVSDSLFTIQRGLITKNIYNFDSDAHKYVREYEISEGSFVGAS